LRYPAGNVIFETDNFNMNKSKNILLTLFLAAVCIAVILLARTNSSGRNITILNPFNDALFPAEFPAPAFEWRSQLQDPSPWEVTLSVRKNDYSITDITDKTIWRPEEPAWDSIKKLSENGKIFFRVRKHGNGGRGKQVVFRISPDSVGAPVLYRQMPIPFVLAERELESMNYMLIDPGSPSPPHIAMKGFPVCGNCHSFSDDGKLLGLDLDAGRRDKGGYFLTAISDTVVFDSDNFMSWSKHEKRSTFGLFSKISPDGRYVVTTLKDRVVAENPPLNSAENFAYSQLFFPVNGHLAIYDRELKTLNDLPGANLEEFVQSNAFWTPDGKSIVFSRAKALPRGDNVYEITVSDREVLDSFVSGKKPFRYDICIIPFNNGKGGTAVPVKGASGNGKSNYFPTVSPDGKWIIYCQANSFMNLMPDSRLYIVPLKGGTPRLLDCNMYAMNSWHSWSPNGKWIIFSSKGLNIYTDLFLSHIDKKGNASIPVLVDRAREYQRVCNYPEFINRNPKNKFSMKYDYVELAHIRYALRDKDPEKARQLFYRLIKQDPFMFSEDYSELSGFLYRMGLKEEAVKYAEIAAKSLKSNIEAD